ncbi:MAG: phosphoenolpyruvate carboxylase [Pseudomonadota bacterium]
MAKKLSQIVKEQQNVLLDIYLKSIPEAELAGLAQFLPPKSYKNQKALAKEFSKLDKEAKLTIGNHQARIADMHTRVRNSVNSKYAASFAETSPIDASSFKFVIDRAAEAKLPKEKLQEILTKTIISNSITAHPTNPYSTKYTAESMELDRILSEPESERKAEKLQEQITKMIAMNPVPLVSEKNKGKKTQTDEVHEAMSYMQNIYKSFPAARRKVQEALEASAQYADVKVGNFYDMGAWLSGDGDGNPAATAESLQNNIDLFRAEIRRLYSNDLAQIIAGLEDSDLKNKLLAIQEQIELDQYQNPQQLINELKQTELPSEFQEQLQDLICRVESFGFRYAKIDIRHDASDINKTVADILIALGRLAAADKKQFLEDLAGDDPEKIASAAKLISDALEADLGTIDTSKFDDVSKRIFGRLRVIAENPGSSDKLIIAECKNQGNALGALFLLKATGNSVGKKDSLNVVTLSESADDLITLPKNIEALLRNPIYRQHVAATGKLIYMIAKSDTQRRDGVGAQFAQELPPEFVTKLFAKLVREYPELKGVTLTPFNGGGHALQRGGGRIDEVPNVYGKAEMRGLNWLESGEELDKDIQIAPPILTTQGHQNGILYSADSASNSLTSYLSQSVWAALKRAGIIKEPEVLTGDGTPNLDAQQARANRKLFFEAARKVYAKEITTPNSPINKLFRNGPWAGVDLTNVSSRPGKRVESSDLQLTDQRAIGADKMCTHSGTHLINWYSAKAGLHAIIDSVGLEQAHQMYRQDKPTRDSFRSMSMSLFMTDFDVAWKMMIGEERPDSKMIEFWAKAYPPLEETDPKLQLRITLAHIEQEAIETAKLIYRTIKNGQAAGEDLSNFTPQDLLTSFWPDLAEEIRDREERLKFAHLVEAELTNNLGPDEKRYPKDQDIEQQIRAWDTACMGSEAPIGSMLTLTKLNEAGLPRTNHEFEVSDELEKELSIVGKFTQMPPSPQSRTSQGFALQQRQGQTIAPPMG